MTGHGAPPLFLQGNQEANHKSDTRSAYHYEQIDRHDSPPSVETTKRSTGDLLCLPAIKTPRL
jgi:hypothetical protein